MNFMRKLFGYQSYREPPHSSDSSPFYASSTVKYPASGDVDAADGARPRSTSMQALHNATPTHAVKVATMLPTMDRPATTVEAGAHLLAAVLPSHAAWCAACDQIIDVPRVSNSNNNNNNIVKGERIGQGKGGDTDAMQNMMSYRCMECNKPFHAECLEALASPETDSRCVWEGTVRQLDSSTPKASSKSGSTSAWSSSKKSEDAPSSAIKTTPSSHMLYSLAFIEPEVDYDSDEDDFYATVSDSSSTGGIGDYNENTMSALNSSSFAGVLTLTRGELTKQIHSFNRLVTAAAAVSSPPRKEMDAGTPTNSRLTAIMSTMRTTTSTAALTDFCTLTCPDSKGSFHGRLRVSFCVLSAVRMHSASKTVSELIGDAVVPPSVSRRLPLDSRVTLSGLSDSTTAAEVVRRVLETLQIVFPTADNFALYEQTLERMNEPTYADAAANGTWRQTRIRRLHRDECPLMVCLSWIPFLQRVADDNATRRMARRFCVQENKPGDVLWESFTSAELSRFAQHLASEERRAALSICRKYMDMTLSVLAELNGRLPSDDASKLVEDELAEREATLRRKKIFRQSHQNQKDGVVVNVDATRADTVDDGLPEFESVFDTMEWRQMIANRRGLAAEERNDGGSGGMPHLPNRQTSEKKTFVDDASIGESVA